MFVDKLDTDVKAIAADLIRNITGDQQKQWGAGTPSDWAIDALDIAKRDAYGKLPEPTITDAHKTYALSDDYVTTATADVASQLSHAGVRLASVLNKALGR